MGNNGIESQEESQVLHAYGQSWHRHFGTVPVFMSKSPPFYFLLKHTDPDVTPRKLELYAMLSLDATSHLVRLHSWRREQPLCSTGGEVLVTFWQYFNFSLEELVVRRTNSGRWFSQDQLWYTARFLSETAQTYASYGLDLSLSPSYTYLTPEGYLKLCPLQAQHKYRRLVETEKAYPSLPSPQELSCARRSLQQARLSEKSQVFSIGMFLLSLMAARVGLFQASFSSKVYSSELEINWEFLSRLLHSHLLLGCYSSSLIGLVEGCLLRDPDCRASLQTLAARVEEHPGQLESLDLSLESPHSAKQCDIKSSCSRKARGYYFRKLICDDTVVQPQ